MRRQWLRLPQFFRPRFADHEFSKNNVGVRTLRFPALFLWHSAGGGTLLRRRGVSRAWIFTCRYRGLVITTIADYPSRCSFRIDGTTAPLIERLKHACWCFPTVRL